jgi:hypothetical protein
MEVKRIYKQSELYPRMFTVRKRPEDFYTVVDQRGLAEFLTDGGNLVVEFAAHIRASLLARCAPFIALSELYD